MCCGRKSKKNRHRPKGAKSGRIINNKNVKAQTKVEDEQHPENSK